MTATEIKTNPTVLKYFSTFSGIGGFELGIGPHGQCVGYSEIDKYACTIYKNHFPNHKNYGDITKIDAKTLPDFDLLLGGFPCQSFSIAGKRGGFSDTRGTMFFELARIIKEKLPRLFMFENVKGLLSHDQGKTFTTIITTLDELGYDCQWQVLNSKNHGVPQNRERVFIVGHSRGTRRPEVFPLLGDDKLPNAKGRTDQGRAQTQISHTLRGSSVKADQVFIKVGKQIRRLTPTECERLQGFPDGWMQAVSDTQRYKTLGNAVTVNVIRDIFNRTINT